MPSNLLKGFDLREYNRNVQRFFLFAIPLFSGMALFSLLYNLYLIRLSYQEDFIGQVAGLFPLASGLLAVPVAIVSDRIGRKPFLVATALVLSISQLGLCIFTDSNLLLAASFAGGIAAAFVFVNFIPFIAENAARERRGQAISIWMSIQNLTRMVVSLVGGTLPILFARVTDTSTDTPHPFRYTLLLGVACSIISLIPLIGMKVSTHPRAQEQATASGERPATPWKHLATFASISAFRGLSMGFSYPFFNVFFQQELGTSTAVIGVVFFLSQLLGFPSTLSSPLMTQRFGATRTIVPLRLLGSLSIAMLGLVLDFHVAVGLFLLSATMEAVTTPTEMIFATNTLPRAYWARLQSVRVTGFQIPAAIASIWAGVLILDHGYWLAFALAGTSRLISAVIFLFAFRRTGSPESPEGR